MIRLSKFFAGLAAASLLAAGLAPAATAQTAAAAERIAPDPSIRTGTLPNGLRYVVQQHAVPAGAVSMRLRFNAGAVDEPDAVAGVAHFVEHMAFNGGRAIPAGTLESVFSERGVAFGRDQNAFTGPYVTTYHLDLPQNDAASLDLGFAWFRDIADGLTLDPARIDRERAIILAERGVSLDAGAQFSLQMRAFVGPELDATRRDSIGDAGTLGRIDAAALRTFYERWYRPENALLIVIGDAPAEALEARVKSTFGSWRGKGPAPARGPARGVDMARPFSPRSWQASTALAPQASFCFKRAPETAPIETVAAARREALRDIWQSVLNQRFTEIAARKDAPFFTASVQYQDDEHAFAVACLDVAPRGDWRTGLAAARDEVRRMAVHGPTEAEVKRVLAQRQTVMRYGRDHADGFSSQALADFDLAEIDRGFVLASLDERYRVEMAVGDITPADVRDAFRRDFSGSGPVMMVVAYIPPTAEQMTSAWAQMDARPDPGPYVPDVSRQWAYADFGKPGRVVERTEVANPAFVRLRFANGVILNFKEAPFGKNQVSVVVAIGGGRAQTGSLHPMISANAVSSIPLGGFGKNSFDDVKKLFPDKLWSLDMAQQSDHYDLGGSTTADSLDVQLQVITALLTDPGFRSEMQTPMLTGLGELYRNFYTQPAFAASEALFRSLGPSSPYAPPPIASVEHIGAQDLDRQYRPILTQEPIEVTVVGDVDETTAVAAVARTLGAIPPRRSPRAKGPPPQFQRFPQTASGGAPETVRVSYQAASPRSAVVVVYPLYVGSQARRREERALWLMSSMFQDALRHRLREEMGETYAPTAQMTLEDGSDQGFIAVYIECEPARAEAVLAAVRAVADDFAAGRITPEALESVRRPVLAGAKDREHQVEWWVRTLNGSARDPDKLELARTWEATYGAITLDEIKTVAKRYLSTPGLSAIALPRR